MIASQRSSDCSTIGAGSFMPAAVTRMSSPPKACTAASTIA
jgi:hypothetical protein